VQSLLVDIRRVLLRRSLLALPLIWTWLIPLSCLHPRSLFASGRRRARTPWPLVNIYTSAAGTLGPGTLGPGTLGPGTLGPGTLGPGTL